MVVVHFFIYYSLLQQFKSGFARPVVSIGVSLHHRVIFQVIYIFEDLPQGVSTHEQENEALFRRGASATLKPGFLEQPPHPF